MKMADIEKTTSEINMKLRTVSSLVALAFMGSAAFAYQPGTYTAAYPGINGNVPVTVTFSKDKIEKIEIGPQKETVGIGENAVKQLPSKIVNAQSIGVDGVTGATVTSGAIFKGVEDCVKQAGGDVTKLKQKPAVKKVAAAAEKMDAELVVIGGGAAGMIAAINAAERGVKVILLEKMSFLGGASSICGGSVVTEGSEIQKKLGVKDDTPTKLAYDLLYNGHQKNDLNAVNFYAHNVGKSIDWIVSKGVKFEDDFSFRAEWRTPRMIPLKGGCPAYAQTLRELIAKSGAKVLLNTKAEELVTDKGAVVGVKAVNTDGAVIDIKAKNVLLATGGYGYNKDMLVGGLKNALYYGPVSSMGEGHKMAEKIGADLQLMEYGKVYPQGIEVAPGIAKSTLQGNIGAYDEAGIMVDRTGHRVINEKGSGKDMIAIQLKEPNATLFLALDPKSFEGFKKRVVKNGVSDKDIAKWLAANGKTAPLFVKGKTLEEAAATAGIDAKNLRETVRRYNEYVLAKDDKEFHRPVKFMNKTIDADGEFYIVEQKPRFATTMGGVKVTTHMEVLDKNGNAIPNLYAAGEVANGVHGDDSAPGANVAWGITTGKTVSDVIADKLGK
jgi:fumarate reductase flavoprotein subunit